MDPIVAEVISLLRQQQDENPWHKLELTLQLEGINHPLSDKPQNEKD